MIEHDRTFDITPNGKLIPNRRKSNESFFVYSTLGKKTIASAYNNKEVDILAYLNVNKNNVKFEWKGQKYTSAINLDKPPSIEYFNIKNTSELELSIRDYLGQLYKGYELGDNIFPARVVAIDKNFLKQKKNKSIIFT